MQRDERGSPSGPMFDNVRTIFIMPNLPKATEDDLVEGYRWLSAELNRHGVTSAYEASFRQREHLSAWRRLREEGALTLRVNMGPYPLYGDEWERDIAAAQVFESGAYSGFGDEWIKLGSLTYGMDGDPMGPHSALFEPYSNDPRGEYRGSFRVSPEKADSFSLAAHSRGWQISAVCFGDHGITVAVDAIEKAQKTFSRANPRHRLEHAHTWNESLLRRCGELGNCLESPAGPDGRPGSGAYPGRLGTAVSLRVPRKISFRAWNSRLRWLGLVCGRLESHDWYSRAGDPPPGASSRKGICSLRKKRCQSSMPFVFTPLTGRTRFLRKTQKVTWR